MTRTEPLLKVRQLTVSFPTETGPLRAVDGAGFALGPGRTLGLVGESGCGKTVTGLALLRLVPPPGRISGGSVLFQGEELTRLSERAMERIRGDRISMVFQEPMTALNPVFTVGDQVAEVFRVHRGLGRAAAWESAVDMLRRVGIPEPAARARDYPHHLSGGMRQRVGIAAALACRPRLLVADEPTTALDVTVQAQILDLMLEMQRELGMALLFVSHNLAAVSEVADEVAVMYAGRVVEQAPAYELFARPLHPYTLGLLETLPRPGGGAGRLPTIPGRVPDLRRLPPGCRFADRCPRVRDRCRSVEPDLVELLPGRQVACWEARP